MFIGNLFLVTYANYTEQVPVQVEDFLLLDGQNFELLDGQEFELLDTT